MKTRHTDSTSPSSGSAAAATDGVDLPEHVLNALPKDLPATLGAAYLRNADIARDLGLPDRHTPAPRFELPDIIAAASSRRGTPLGERHIAGRVRRIIAAWAELPDRRHTPELVAWVRKQTARWLQDKSWPMAEPSRTVRVDISGATNTYISTFGPPATYRSISRKASNELKRSGSILTEADLDRQGQAFHRRERRLVWQGPDGIFIDEVRVGPAGDNVLDGWMHRKVNCDLTLGAALSHRLNVPFLGVRILPLRATEEAVLAVAGPGGTIVTVDLRAALPHLVSLPDLPDQPGALVQQLLDDPIFIQEQAHNTDGSDIDAAHLAKDEEVEAADTLSDDSIVDVLEQLEHTDRDAGADEPGWPHEAAS